MTPATPPALLDPSGAVIPTAEVARIRMQAGMPQAGIPVDYEAPYVASSLARQDVAAWRPPNTSGDYASLQRRDITVARVQDLLRNDRHARAAENRLFDMLVGKGLLCCPKPDYQALGISHEGSRDLAPANKLKPDSEEAEEDAGEGPGAGRVTDRFARPGRPMHDLSAHSAPDRGDVASGGSPPRAAHPDGGPP